MKRSSCSCGLWGGLRGGLVAAALASLLGGCSLTDDVFGSGPGNNEPSATPQPVPGPAAGTTPQTDQTSQGQTIQGQTTQGQTTQGQTTTQGGYPNLGTVPQQAPTTTSSADRQQLASGLVADNQNAAYSDQPVTAAQQSGTPAPAPIPPPVPAPAAAPAATDTPASTVSVTPMPAPAPAPQPQPQPTSQTTVGQTVTNQPTQTVSTTPEPAATVVQLPAPAPASGATPMAPPPNPIPASPAPIPTMVASSAGVTVDNSQLSGSPLAGYPPAPGSAPGYASAYNPGYAPAYASAGGAAPAAYGLPAGVAPVAGQPVAVVFFTESSSALSDRAQWVLHNVYLLQQQQGGRLRLVGNASLHTVTMDPQQHDQVNYRISQSRANAVARALINMGVPQGSIGVAAQGSQAPIFYEFMPTGEAANRRVEIYLDR
jgi:outer membrane protein OmpA-like peptidoglycan-associated protein